MGEDTRRNRGKCDVAFAWLASGVFQNALYNLNWVSLIASTLRKRMANKLQARKLDSRPKISQFRTLASMC